MSDMSRERDRVGGHNSVPSVPGSVPSFYEARSLAFPLPFPAPPTRFPPPPQGGNGERGGTGNRLSRHPSLRLHHCDQHTLVGLDDEVAALTARVDPYPLSPAGEVAALRDRRYTYALLGGRLERRDRWNIPGHPPGHDLLVLADHRCDAPIPDHWRQPPAPRPATIPTEVCF